MPSCGFKRNHATFLLVLLGLCLAGCRAPLNGGTFAADTQPYYLVPAQPKNRGFFGNLIDFMFHSRDEDWEVRYYETEDYSKRKSLDSEDKSILK
jgi:hypothetical protein